MIPTYLFIPRRDPFKRRVLHRRARLPTHGSRLKRHKQRLVAERAAGRPPALRAARLGGCMLPGCWGVAKGCAGGDLRLLAIVLLAAVIELLLAPCSRLGIHVAVRQLCRVHRRPAGRKGTVDWSRQCTLGLGHPSSPGRSCLPAFGGSMRLRCRLWLRGKGGCTPVPLGPACIFWVFRASQQPMLGRPRACVPEPGHGRMPRVAGEPLDAPRRERFILGSCLGAARVQEEPPHADSQ